MGLESGCLQARLTAVQVPVISRVFFTSRKLQDQDQIAMDVVGLEASVGCIFSALDGCDL